MNVSTKRPKPNVNLKVYDIDMLRFFYPEWDTLEKSEKLKLLRNSGRDAYERIETYNATTDLLHEYLALCVNPSRHSDKEIEWMVFGDDNSSFGASDRDMNNRIGSVDITDISTNTDADETVFATFVDSTELNGHILREIGIETTDGDLWNHAEISPEVEKTESKTLVAEVYVGFSN